MNEKIIDIQVVAFEEDDKIHYTTKLAINGESDLVAEALGLALTKIGCDDMELLVKILAEHKRTFNEAMGVQNNE